MRMGPLTHRPLAPVGTIRISFSNPCLLISASKESLMRKAPLDMQFVHVQIKAFERYAISLFPFKGLFHSLLPERIL